MKWLNKIIAFVVLVAVVSLSQAATVYDVRTYGAKCDGTTDDTAAINNTIIAAGTLSGGPTTVQLPPGICIVNAGVSDAIIIGYDNIDLAGAGTFATILKNKSTSRATIIHAYKGTYPGGLALIKNITVRNLTVDGNQANITHNPNDTYENGIVTDYCQNCTVHNTEVKNVVYQGIILQGSGEGSSKDDRVYSNNVSACGEVGIGLEGGIWHSTVENNNIHDLITVSEVSGGAVGIVVEQIGQTGFGNLVTGNIVDNIPSDGIRVQDGSDYTSVTANNISNTGTTSGSAIKINFQIIFPNHVTVSNNIIKAGSDKNSAAIMSLGSSGAVGFTSILNNKISDSAGGGVQVNAGTGYVIAGNSIVNVGTGAGTITSAIRVSGSSANVEISGNMMNTVAGNGVEVLSGSTGVQIKNTNRYLNISGLHQYRMQVLGR